LFSKNGLQFGIKGAGFYSFRRIGGVHISTTALCILYWRRWLWLTLPS